MKEYTALRWFLFKFSGIFIMVISLAFIYVIFFLAKEYHIKSLVTFSDIVEYNGKIIISISGMPLFIYTFFFALRMVLKKGISPLTKGTIIGEAWGLFSVLSFALGLVASYLIPIVLLMLHYTSCHEDKLRVYYVSDPRLCMMIEKK